MQSCEVPPSVSHRLTVGSRVPGLFLVESRNSGRKRVGLRLFRFFSASKRPPLPEGVEARDQAALANARTDLQRYHILLPQEAIPEQQLTTQEATVRQLEATVKTDQAAIDDALRCSIYNDIG